MKQYIVGGLSGPYTEEEILTSINKRGVNARKQLEMGIEVEMEHTSSKKIAKQIALDHLVEIPDYYTRLKKMEEAGERYWKSR